MEIPLESTLWYQPKTLQKLSQKLTMIFMNFKEGVSK